MQTHFTASQLLDPKIAEADKILRSCVHCGFCTATCPTFVLTGDERDSPRGRIWMLREVLENPASVSADTGFHIDRCLGCLSCTSTCPSGVDYPHLLDIGRDKIDALVPRSYADKALRYFLARVIPHAGRFRLMIQLARLGKLFRWAMPKRVRAALDKIPLRLSAFDRTGAESQTYHATTVNQVPDQNKLIKRVVLLAGCAQRVLDPDINASTIRLLNRLGVDVVVRAEAHCCGALAHHIGEAETAHQSVRTAVRSWYEELVNGKADAIITNASGCGTMVKDYGHMMKDDASYAAMAKAVSAAAMDISELLGKLDIGTVLPSSVSIPPTRIAYHSACSLQHGQKIHDLPIGLLRKAGFEVVEPLNGHICCGSAGVYNILQPDLADQLRDRKLASLDATGAGYVAAGNIGCITQLNRDIMPVRHLVQFLDWATGGPRP